jgi:uncharacterized Zn finger protein (UPF0148 family)
MFGYCKQCKRVYDFVALFRERRGDLICPECGVPVYAPSEGLLRRMEQQKQEKKQPEPPRSPY